MKAKTFLLSSILLCPFLISCNIFSPFEPNSSAQDHVEEALKCLGDSDTSCAVRNYEALPEGPEKQRRICEVKLAEAGLTLSILIDTLLAHTDDSKLLGTLATALMPWTETKGTAAADAVTNCSAYSTSSNQSALGLLLKVLGHFVDCATRISRADILRGNSDSDETCDTPATGDNLARRNDIKANSLNQYPNPSPELGEIPSGGTGMCRTDVQACKIDITELGAISAELAGELKKMQDAYKALPAELKDASNTVNEDRAALLGAVAD